jgi:hypothetical protein
VWPGAALLADIVASLLLTDTAIDLASTLANWPLAPFGTMRDTIVGELANWRVAGAGA